MRDKRLDATVESAPETARALGNVATLAVLVFVSYTLSSLAALKISGPDVGRAFFHPAAGVTVAAAILTRRSRWPVIAGAIVLGDALIGLIVATPPALIAGHSLANVVEPMTGAALATLWCAGRPELRDRHDLAAFLGAACLIGPAVGGLIGGTATHLWDHSGWAGSVVHWWIADGLGVLVVATPILLWGRQSSIVRGKPWEFIIVAALTAAVSSAAFLGQISPSILVLPLLAWAALRLDMLGAALAGGVLTTVASIMTAHGHSALEHTTLSPAARLILNELFVTVVTIVALLVAQEAAGRAEADRERETERRERVRLAGLSQLAQRLSAALTPEDIGRALRDHVLTEAAAQGVSLGLLNRKGNHLEWVAAPGYPRQVQEDFNPRSGLDAPLLGPEVVRAGEPVMVPSQAEYERRYGASVRWLTMGGTQSIAGWPLTAGGKPFGVLVMIWAEPQSFDAAQVAYISAVSALVSQALVRARLHVDEHARAAVLQSALVPDNPGDTAGVEVCVRSARAVMTERLGGSWCDILTLPDGRIYAAVGDVVGHGLPAVEDTAQLRTAGRALAHQGLRPDRLLAELNSFTRHTSHGKFATMAVALLDVAGGELTYCSARHAPPLVRRSATGEVLSLSDSVGPMLGDQPETAYAGRSVPIARGDVLVMYTGGSGISGARGVLAGWAVDARLADCCAELHEVLRPPPGRDDVSIIAVRFHLDPESHPTVGFNRDDDSGARQCTAGQDEGESRP